MNGCGTLTRVPGLAALAVIALLVPVPGQAFDATIVRSDDADSTCVAAGTPAFTAGVRVRTPAAIGTVYVTLRLSIPEVLSLVGPPALHPGVQDRIVTRYPDGTEEWNLILEGCPDGWFLLLTQDFAVTGTGPATLSVSGADSWIRACDFTLHRVNVLADLPVNRENCGAVPVTSRGWSALKERYRSPVPDSAGR